MVNTALLMKKGDELGEGFIYEELSLITENLANAIVNGKWGFVDFGGNSIGKGFIYDNVCPFGGFCSCSLIK